MNEVVAFLESYGYLAVLVGSVFEGEIMLFVAGILSHKQVLDLSFPIIFMAAALGALVGDSFWFLLARYRRAWVRARMPRAYARAHGMFVMYEKRPRTFAAGMRFMYGFRTLVPLSMGLSQVPYRTFVYWNALGALAWSTVLTGAGYYAGAFLTDIFGRLPLREVKMIILIAILLALAYVAHRIIERGARKVAHLPTDTFSEN